MVVVISSSCASFVKLKYFCGVLGGVADPHRRRSTFAGQIPAIVKYRE